MPTHDDEESAWAPLVFWIPPSSFWSKRAPLELRGLILLGRREGEEGCAEEEEADEGLLWNASFNELV